MPDSATTKALELPEVDRAAIPALNTVVGARRSIATQIADDACAIEFCAAGNPTGHAVEIASPVGVLWMWLAEWDGFSKAKEVLADAEIARLPRDLWPATLSVVFEAELDRLAQLAGGPCEIASVVAVEELPADLHTIGLRIVRSQANISGCLWTDAAGLDWLRGAVENIPPTAANSVDALVLQAAVEIGMTMVPAAELRAMRPHDLLVMDIVAPADKPAGLLRLAPQFVWRVAIDEGELTLVEQVHPEHPAEESAGAAEVRVVFERGLVRAEVTQLTELADGSTLPMHDDQTVTLRSGLHTLGRGELVQIAGCTAVRVLDWFPAGD